jgi:hypothetical protein
MAKERCVQNGGGEERGFGASPTALYGLLSALTVEFGDTMKVVVL